MRISRFSLRNICRPSRLLALSGLLLVSSSLSAQCLVNSLDVSTGVANGALVAVTNPATPDPHWRCVNKTGGYVGTTPLAPAQAEVVAFSGWATGPGTGRWISDSRAHVISAPTIAGTLTFEREFTLCDSDEVTIQLDIRADGIVNDIYVDAPTGSPVAQPSSPWSWCGSCSPWTPPTLVFTLGPGVHKLTVVLDNPNPSNSSNPGGVLVMGQISTVNNSIVNDQNADCAGYSCPPPVGCNDECYWKLDGNNINPGRNIFGTLTDDDIRIVTNGSSTPDRGVITGGNAVNGGYLGWNTTAPTARLHVDCINGNNRDRLLGLPSDIRFENLEGGSGNILVIDNQGYVYNSGHYLQYNDGVIWGIKEMQEEIRDLKAQVASLQGTKTEGAAGRSLEKLSILYQNTPNPFTKETSIRYNVVSMKGSASIIIYDLNGRQLKKYDLAVAGEGSVTVTAETLRPGMYLYSLVIDGQESDTKRMILTE